MINIDKMIQPASNGKPEEASVWPRPPQGLASSDACAICAQHASELTPIIKECAVKLICIHCADATDSIMGSRRATAPQLMRWGAAFAAANHSSRGR
jgi:hypothetical protein